MTDIDQLSGRDLDAAIAEKLFGWTWQDYASGRVVGYPEYQSSWEAMRLVVEEMQRRGWDYDLCNHHNGGHVACFDRPVRNPPFFEAHADSLPTAVCRAALKALETEKR